DRGKSTSRPHRGQTCCPNREPPRAFRPSSDRNRAARRLPCPNARQLAPGHSLLAAPLPLSHRRRLDSQKGRPSPHVYRGDRQTPAARKKAQQRLWQVKREEKKAQARTLGPFYLIQSKGKQLNISALHKLVHLRRPRRQLHRKRHFALVSKYANLRCLGFILRPQLLSQIAEAPHAFSIESRDHIAS